MIKKGQVSIFVIVGIFLVGALVLLGWLSMNRKIEVNERECSVNEDCVPNECCDSEICVPANEAPDCSFVFCPPGCYNYPDLSTGCDNPETSENERGICVCEEEHCKIAKVP
ncbi:MAG: hypothetical protein KKD18_01005 [Nanoarchaeota archaeon]|nr:hypothetical protein [Nanoarchaeota archaeon]